METNLEKELGKSDMRDTFVKTLVEKNRLQIFSNFTSFNNNKSKLFSDIKFLVEEDSHLYKRTK